MTICEASVSDIDECVAILKDTEIGRAYYPSEKLIKFKLMQGLNEDCFFVAKSENGIMGFIWFNLHGAFASYPYLHLIVVSKSYRNQGVGKALLEYFEEYSLQALKSVATKTFLVVADFNESAFSFYIQNGYEKIGEISGLFRPNITERFMQKQVRKTR